MPPLQGCGLATFADHQSAADAILALDGVYMWPNFHDPMVNMMLEQFEHIHEELSLFVAYQNCSWALVVPAECGGSRADGAAQWQARRARGHSHA